MSSSAAEFLEGFSSPQFFTAATASTAPREGGVHVVLDDDVPIYVGETGNLRRRLREHHRGDRQASVLHEQVGAELDADGRTATAEDIAAWLGGRSVRWCLSDGSRELKAQLVAALRPRYNRSGGGYAFKGGRSLDALAELVEQFRVDVGYPAGGRNEQSEQRAELAAALTPDGLVDPDVRLLRRMAGPAYGSPGPQPGFNTLLQSEDGTLRVTETLQHLLYGPGDVIERLEECLSGARKLPKVGVAMMVKALAVNDPDRWIPCYVTSGKVGKLAILDLLGAERPDVSTPGARAAVANDALRTMLEPHLPGDPWGMQEFSWWLLHREHVPETPLATLADELYLSEEFLARILRLLADKGQVVFYGPPGTGKTYAARKLAGHIARGGGTVEKIQFHASYSYEDLIEGYRPRLVNGQVTYEVVDGPLKRLAASAQERPDVTHVLLIDELNRGNVSKILGELLFLLEYRDEEIRLLYSETPFSLPPNLHIIATMNTADRSIALVDTALRRRFHFVPFFPDTPPIDTLLRRWLADQNPQMSWVADVVDRANSLLADRNIAIGPSHFLKANLSEDLVDLAWEASVLPFLEEHFFSDPDQLRRFELGRLRADGTSTLPTEVPDEPGTDPGLA